MNYDMLFCGFGGQGVLFAGKIAAYCGLLDGRAVSWLPSYGPEMRGGTANCSVCLSEEEIGSPLVTQPNVLLALNGPSYHKFVNAVQPGGYLFYDSSLIEAKEERKDIRFFGLPATRLADEKGLTGAANIILLGKLAKETSFAQTEILHKAIEKCVHEKRKNLLAANWQALDLGFSM
ncbi:MAG: 2-oxoacid:acceptor oxidoreductase family protein [Oscillospiraceae bacterium]